MDIFIEYIVKHKRGSREYLILFGAVFGALILSLALILFGSVLFQFGGIALLLLAGFWYGAYIAIKFTFNIEYEYILTNNELDVDKIMAKSRRKRIITIDFKNIHICAPIDSPEHKYEYENTEGITKVYDFTGIGQEKNYFIDTEREGARVRVIFSPTEKILEAVYKFNPRKIIK